MASVTLSTLRTRVRERADAESSDFFTDSLLTTFLNASLDELYERIATAYPGTYFYDEASFTTAGTDISLPADFLKLLGVDLLMDGRPVDLDPIEFKERNAYEEGVASGLQGVIHYVPTRPQLSQNNDAVNFPNGWEEWAVIDAAIKCKVKEETDFQALQLAKQEANQRILEAASGRDVGAPPSAVDIYNTGPSGYFPAPWAYPKPRYRMLGSAPGVLRLYRPRVWW